jgi:serine/threonine protein kinase/tetratricopeptide (TPR) repeat protein
MILAPCPSTEDLRRFLGEQLGTTLHTHLSSHIDTCSSCQQALEALTQGNAYDLPGLGENPCAPTETCDQIGTATSPNPAQVCESRTRRDDATLEQPRSSDGETTDNVGVPSAEASRSEDSIRGWPRLPSYEILEVIREGGMGVVYRARQLGLNRLVALKMVRGERASPDHYARFRIEAEAIARLKHPNIVPIYEINEVDGQPFLSLELLEGGTLDDRLAGNPQPSRHAAELMITLARAVQVAHDAGIIHRDLKPSNVLFTPDGVPKITDFGLAKRIESDSRQTESGAIMGTPCYMAPEQARGHTRDVGPAADTYALGAILYEMLTGRPPFKGETPIETVRQVVEDDVVPPSRLVPKLARDMETICLHCLHKEPGRRYASAGALAADLDRFLTGRPIKARPTPFWERGIKLARRHPVAATLLALGLAATAGLTAAWRDYNKREATRLSGVRAATSGSIAEAQALLTRGKWDRAAQFLSGAQATVSREPALGDLTRQIESLLAQADQQKADQERQEAERQTRDRDQARLATFRSGHRDVLFRETRFAELPYDRNAVTSSATAALAVFGRSGEPDSWDLAPLPASFTPGNHKEIKEHCYELLLILADAEPALELGLKLLEQAAPLAPPTRVYHLRRADCLMRRGDATAAASERKQAESVPLDLALDHFLMGKDLYKRGEWAKAIPQFDAVLLNQPGHFWSHYFSALCSLQLRRPVPAKAELTSCLQTEPALAWLHILRGLASYQIATLARAAAENLQTRGDTLRTEIELQLQAAEKDYKRAFELLATAPNKDLRYALLVNRGLLWHERKAWDKAEADLQAAIQLDDQRWQAFETLAQAYARQDRSDEAMGQFTRAIALRPDWAPLYRARAGVNLDRKDQSQEHRAAALADLERAIRLEPAGSSVLALDHTRCARLLHQEGREDAALAACDAALKIDPGYMDAHRVRVDVLRKLKRYEEVISSCDTLVMRGKPSPELYEFRGLAKEKLRDYQGAIEDQTLAIAMDPGNAASRAKRGALYLVTDAPRSALRDFDKAIELDAASADSLLGRGLALAAVGQHREAVADAAKAMGMAEPTATRLYNAARIHAQAAAAAASEARKTGQDAVSLVTRYQDQAMRLLGEWQKKLPAAERAGSMRSLTQDPAMAILRRRLRALELAGASSSFSATPGQPRP